MKRLLAVNLLSAALAVLTACGGRHSGSSAEQACVVYEHGSALAVTFSADHADSNCKA